jgi:large subunit ribosomal protein L25
MAELELRARRRAVVGKKVRFLRREGLLPASLYGPGVESTALELPAREAEAVLRRATSTTLLPLYVDEDTPRRVLVRQVQRHPVSDQALHVDFFALPMNETTRAQVPLHFVGDAPAVTQFEGTLVRNLETVEVECLPMDLPARLDVDLTAMADLNSVIHASELELPSGVTLLTSPEATLISVVPPRVETEAAAEAAEPTEAPAATAEAETEAAAEETPTEEATS